MSIIVKHVDANTYTVQLPIPGARSLPTDIVEWSVVQTPNPPAPSVSGIWVLGGHKVIDTNNVRSDIVFNAGSGAYEYAIQLGTASSDGDFIGNAHGYETVDVTASWLLDGSPLSIGIGGSAIGQVLTLTQTKSVYLPPGGGGASTIVAGDTTVIHRFTSVGIYVQHTHIYRPTYMIVDTGYGMMLPIGNAMFAGSPVVDTFRVGTGAPIAVAHDNGTKGNAQASQIEFYSGPNVHPFRSRLNLPSGGPNLLSSDGLSLVPQGSGWDQSILLQAFVVDRVAPNGPKGYVTFVSLPFATPRNRVAANTMSGNVFYQVVT